MGGYSSWKNRVGSEQYLRYTIWVESGPDTPGAAAGKCTHTVNGKQREIAEGEECLKY